MGQGKQLQSLLKEKNITVTKLAELAGISPNTLYAIIKRDSGINIDNMKSLAQALQMTLDELSSSLQDSSIDTAIEDNNSFEESLNLDLDFIETLGDEDVLILVNRLKITNKELLKVIDEVKQVKTEKNSLLQQRQKIDQKLAETDSVINKLTNRLKNLELEMQILQNKLVKKMS